MIHVNNFHVCGVSHQTATLEERAPFALSDDQISILSGKLNVAESPGMVLTTCNRTEIYFFASTSEHVVHYLAEVCGATTEKVKELVYIKSGADAFQHLLRVSVGLESQIMGDFEIVGQVKKAFVAAQEHGTSHGLLERMVNSAVHASRKVKNETEFSSGMSSVSYASVRYLRDRVDDLADKKILIYGLGKMGRVTLENLLKHNGADNISILNKTYNKTVDFAAKYGVKAIHPDETHDAISTHDIIIVATTSKEPLIFAVDIDQKRPTWVLDLSVPNNVDKAVRNMQNVHLVDVDELSKTVNEHLANRMAEVPKVQEIIIAEVKQFIDWYHRKEMALLSDYIENSLRDITRDALAHNGFNGDVESITDEIASRHKKMMFDHLRQFFSSGHGNGNGVGKPHAHAHGQS